MRVAVCVKHIPDGRLRIDPGSKRLDRTGRGELNKVDLNALEEALRLKDARQAEVVVISIGPDKAVESVRTALALGADRAVLITDPAVVGSDLIATAKLLAKALAREEFDLVLFGQQSADSSGGALWAAVAELLRFPVVSQATALVVTDDQATVTRQTEYGDEVIESPLPIVVSVSDAINEPRYASLKGMMAAKRKPLETLSLEGLEFDPGEAGEDGAKTVVLDVFDPPARGGAMTIDNEESAAQEIFDFLAAKELL